MLVIAHDEEGDAAGHEDGDVEDHVCFGHLLQVACLQAVQDTMQQCGSSHHADSLPVGGYVCKVGAHGYRCEQQLPTSILGRCCSSDLTQEIQPAYQPANLRNPGFGREVFAGEVQPATGWVCRDQFGDGQGDAIATAAGDQPAPYRRGSSAGFQGVYVGGGDGSVEAGDGEGEGDTGQPGELALVDL